MVSARKNKGANLLQFALIIAGILLINFISSFKFVRADLTEERIHSLSPTTKEVLQNDSIINDILQFEVYLDGELPAEINRLRYAIEEKLDEFKAYGGSNVQVKFINPAEDLVQLPAIEKMLYEHEVFKTIVSIPKGDGVEAKAIFPGFILRYGGKTTSRQLIPPYNRPIRIDQLNHFISGAINQIEYTLLDAIYQVAKPHRPRIGMLQGHGELDRNERSEIDYELGKLYSIEEVTIDGKLEALKGLDALMIANPKSSFNEKDKFIIDQFAMNGGKIAWLLDPVIVNKDSLFYTNKSIISPRKLNLNKQLFKYGVRINTNLAFDLQCAKIHFNKGQDSYKWFFYPKLSPFSQHIITDNLFPVRMQYASTLDTLDVPGIRKTVLLATSENSMHYKTGATVNYNLIQSYQNLKSLKRPIPKQPVAVLLEGKFESDYKNRMAGEFLQLSNYKFKENSQETKMLVITDGDFCKNELDTIVDREMRQRIYPVSINFDRYNRGDNYGNKEFLANCMDYLLGNKNIIPLRNRKLKPRVLNPQNLTEQSKWQTINVAMPIVLLLLIGIFAHVFRNRKYAS